MSWWSNAAKNDQTNFNYIYFYYVGLENGAMTRQEPCLMTK